MLARRLQASERFLRSPFPPLHPPLHLLSPWAEGGVRFPFPRGACGLEAPARLPGSRELRTPREVPSPEQGLRVSGRGGRGWRLWLWEPAAGVGSRPGGGAASRRGCGGPRRKPDPSARRATVCSRGFPWPSDCAGNAGLGGRGPRPPGLLSLAASGLLNWITPAADATSPADSNSEI